MPRKSLSVRSRNTLLFVLSTAAAGQFFLAQGDRPYTLWIGLLFYGLSIWKLAGFSDIRPAQNSAFSLKSEMFLLTMILVLGFFLRIYRIDSLPAGMHTDQGLIGQCALRILHEGWRPFGEVFDYEVPEIVLFYQMAGWFGLAGSSYFTFHLFFALLSLAAFPLIYWTLRQWSGPRVALLSLFLLAVMRWNWIASRNGYPSIQVQFYLFGALAFWLYGCRKGKKWAFYLSVLFVAVGFYTYQAFKIVPFLMGLLAYHEYSHQKKKLSRPFLSYFLLVVVLTVPLLAVMAQKGQIGHRESDLFIGTKIIQTGSLKPLWDVWVGTALMFNRQGDENPRHNIPGHRMLDDGTAVFFVLGLVLAWRRRKEPGGFYPLACLGVMLLTGLLSTDPAHANRLVSLTPFAAYFAGTAMDFTWKTGKALFKSTLLPVFGILLLAGLTVQNTYTYFVQQANDERCQTAFGLEQTMIGRTIESSYALHPGQNRYFISPSYYGNHTVLFLSYPARNDVEKFQLREWALGLNSKEKPALIFLESEKWGWLDFLQRRYQAPVEAYSNNQGKAYLYSCPVYPEEMGRAKPWDRGLKGIYISSRDWNEKPVTILEDPVVNFVSKYDFPFIHFPPFRIRWTGDLDIPKTGEYLFQILTTDSAQLWLDGKAVTLEKPWVLKAGPHRLRLDFEKDNGDAMALHFIWKKPGDSGWEVVPATAFGKISR